MAERSLGPHKQTGLRAQSIGRSICPRGWVSACAGSDFVSMPRIRLAASAPNESSARSLRENGERTAIHEMAHVYHFLTDLAVNPAAIAVGQIYIHDFIKDSDVVCRTEELYADIPEILMHADELIPGSGTRGYWRGCRRAQGRDPRWPENDGRWQELLDVMRSIHVHQEVPQWFYDTYQRADGTWDIEGIKATLGYYGDDSTYRQLRYLIPALAIEVEEEETLTPREREIAP